MRSRVTRALPARLEAVRRRFELWRRTRQGRSRIPEKLWTSAVKLAATYGLCRTARALRLDYNALKQHLESAGLKDSPAGLRPRRRTPARGAPAAKHFTPATRIQKRPPRNPAMTFVELPPLERSGAPECIVELENPHGLKMRICLTGRQSSEVVTAVSRVFLGAGS